MATFHNTRLPTDVERGARGGPRFNTSIMELASGFERRNINWSLPRLRWDISYGIQSKSDLNDVIKFFYARQGRAYGFRFKDWTDYEVGSSGSPVAIATAVGGETTTQIVKPYTSGGVTLNRPLTRIVAGTTEVYLDTGAGDVLQTETTNYTLDDDTGLISWVSPASLSAADVVSVYTEFDVAVRFDTDDLDIQALYEDALSVPAISIVELREALAS